MSRFLTMKRLGLLFAALFGLSMVGLFVYQHFYGEPREKCIAEGRWWYAEGRECVTPIYLPDITGRAPGVTREEASREKNRELIEIEARLEAEKEARTIQTQRDRDALLGRTPD
jgi:hypothetical protein